jgi:hypothetical protein
MCPAAFTLCVYADICRCICWLQLLALWALNSFQVSLSYHELYFFCGVRHVFGMPSCCAYSVRVLLRLYLLIYAWLQPMHCAAATMQLLSSLHSQFALHFRISRSCIVGRSVLVC